MFTRDELIKSKEYWLETIQNKLFEKVDDYLKKKKINRTEFAEELGVSKGYVSQVLSGSYDHRISKLIELLLAINIAPEIPMDRTLDMYIRDDRDDVNYLNAEVRGIRKLSIQYKPFVENQQPDDDFGRWLDVLDIELKTGNKEVIHV